MSTLLSDAAFVVVDTETTGGRAAEDRVIEIGAVRLQGGKVVDQFQQLVNPECAVPYRITRLTGISSAMVFDQPTMQDVLPAFLAFIGTDVLVAHNMTFDLRFLNSECRRIGRPELVNDTLCTLRLARRLLPGLRSKGLASVTDFYGIRNRRHHRALADADATAQVLARFVDQASIEFGTEHVSEFVALQYRNYSSLKQVSKHIVRIREDVLGDVPTGPGVYFMKDARGKTIYVGKAQNLRNRVRSYFSSVEGHPPRIRKMVKAVRDVEWEETDSELDALLLESRLIKETQPSYNRAQKRYVNRPFIRIDSTHAYPRVSTSAFVHDDGAEYYGPMASRGEAEFVVEVIDRFFQLRECDDAAFSKGRRCVYASIDRCAAPCDSADLNYHEEVDRVRAFLLGRDASVISRVEHAMRESAAALDYEQAGAYRDWVRRLERMTAKREAVASRVLEHNAVVVHRAEGKPVRLLIIARGRHVDTLTPADGTDALRRAVDRHFLESTDGPTVYRQQEVDELHLLAHWLYVHRNDLQHVRWVRGESADAFVHRVGSCTEDAMDAMNVAPPASMA